MAFLLLMAVMTLGAGCGERPPSTLDEIRNVKVDGPITFEPKKIEDPNEIFVKLPQNDTPSASARPDKVAPLPGILPPAALDGKKVRIHTGKGDIVFALLGREAPIAASNMIWLAGQRYYDSLTFHRVEYGFVIQGGDPNGNGSGGPGYSFPDERVRRPYSAGVVAMANSGPDTNGSQFFITLANQPRLPPRYTIFGQVIEGMEVVKKISPGDVMMQVTVE